MGIRTISLKLYKPGNRKKQIIEDAMQRYTEAYQFLLDKAIEQEDFIEKKFIDERGSYRAVNINKWIDSNLLKQLNTFGIEPFKDSLKLDFSMTLASYLSLKKIQGGVKFPMAYMSDLNWRVLNDNALDDLEDGNIEYSQYLKNMRKISQKCEVQKPLFFCRYDNKRDYCLIYDEKKNKYYAKLYLMNVKDVNRKELNTDTQNEFLYIHKNNGVLEKSKRRERFILVPLSFGKWQENYLKTALENPGMLKTARLVKRNEEYYLSINIDIGEKEEIKTDTYLGLSRGLKKLLHYTVVDSEGKVMMKSCFENNLLGENQKEFPLNVIHEIANEIVEAAEENKAQVIVQAFVDRGDKLQWKDEDNRKVAPLLNYRSYNKLLSILEYKLEGKGLPSPVKVSPVGIFYTCPKCGLHMVKNRSSKDIFICVECGTAVDVESLGSLNMARKLIKYKSGLIKVKVEKTDTGVRFLNRDLGMDFVPLNPMDCLDDFILEIRRLMNEFYENINKMQRDKVFKKRYSLIKKIEQYEDLTGLIELI